MEEQYVYRVIGVIVFFVVLCIILFFLYKKNNKKSNKKITTKIIIGSESADTEPADTEPADTITTTTNIKTSNKPVMEKSSLATKITNNLSSILPSSGQKLLSSVPKDPVKAALEYCKDNGIMLTASVAGPIAMTALKTVINKTSKKIMGESLEQALNKSITKTLSKSMKMTSTVVVDISKKISAKSANTIVSKIGSAVSSKTASKLTTISLTKIAEVAAKSIGEKILKTTAGKLLKTAGSKAASFGVNLAGKTSAGPVGWATMVFSAGSMIVDLADMGTNFTGFQVIANNKDIDEVQKMANETYEASYREQNMEVPFNGPLKDIDEKIIAKEQNDLSISLINQVYAEYTALSDQYLSKLDINSLNLSPTELTDFINQLYTANTTAASDIINSPEFDEFVNQQFCIKYDGIYVNKKCSYKDYDSCNKGNKNPNEAYYEFKNGICGMTSHYAKDICNKNNLQYLPDKQHCKITKEYCTLKAQDYKSDNDGTCVDDIGATIFGAIFGDTLTKEFKRIFDTTYTYTRSMKPIRLQATCENGKIYEGGFCVDKCNPGYKSTGFATCQYNGDVKLKRSYTRQHECPPDRDNVDGMCALKCRPGLNPVGSPTCSALTWKPWPSVEIQDRNPITIFDFLKECDPGYRKTPFGTCIEDCPPNYTDTGVACIPNIQDRKPVPLKPSCENEDFELYAGACYKKCKPGYKSVALNCTLSDCPQGYYMNNGICVSN